MTRQSEYAAQRRVLASLRRRLRWRALLVWAGTAVPWFCPADTLKLESCLRCKVCCYISSDKIGGRANLRLSVKH